VDRQSPRYENKRFTKDFHAYSRFTAMALKAGVAWHPGPSDGYASDKQEKATQTVLEQAELFGAEWAEQAAPALAEPGGAALPFGRPPAR